MCLSLVYDKIPKTNGYGYKVFSTAPNNTDHLFGPHYSLNFSGYVLKKYYDCPRTLRIYSVNSNRYYNSGFHIFMNLKDAKEYCRDFKYRKVYRVRYSRVVAAGTQECNFRQLPCVIAKRMKILNRVD